MCVKKLAGLMLAAYLVVQLLHICKGCRPKRVKPPKKVTPTNSSRFLFKEIVPSRMLTLIKDKGAQEIVGMYSKKSRSVKPMRTVYYTHDTSPEKENVAPARGVLELHRDSLKRMHKISQAAFDRICGMLDTHEEPEVGENGPAPRLELAEA